MTDVVTDRILIIEDDKRLAEMVSNYLSEAGFATQVSRTGMGGIALHDREPFDVLILDLMLPDIDGLDVCRRIREKSQTPILMLTARGDAMDRVVGLEMGADDYLPKPFELAELEARIKALLRRAGNQVPLVRLGRLEFDTTTRMAAVDGQALALTPRELAVLEALLARVGRPVAREALFEKVFEFDADARVEAIEIYVSRLRKKLEGAGVAINTLRGLGYLLAEKPAA